MKLIIIFIISLTSNLMYCQNITEKANVEKACLNYIEGFYEGDTLKLKKCIKTTLYKFGYWKKKDSKIYEPEGLMTYKQAITYAEKVLVSKKFAKNTAPKEITVLDISNKIAVAKVKAWWGIDYMLLSKEDDNWMIEQVLWEGPLEK